MKRLTLMYNFTALIYILQQDGTITQAVEET